jgi:hypothetical protein
MLKIEIDTAKLQKALRIAPVLIRQELGDALDHISRSFFKTFYRTRLKGPPGVSARGGRGGLFGKFRKRILGSSQGTLSNKIKSSTTISEIVGSGVSTENMGIEIFTRSTAAYMHEFGGTVGSGKLMPVPLGNNLSRSQQAFAKAGRLVPVKINGKLFLIRAGKKVDHVEPLFILKGSITLKPRLGFYSTWQGMENKTIERLNTAINRAIQKV